jgi:methylated-DNA-[protein]-cysteine S-methyltransferase
MATFSEKIYLADLDGTPLGDLRLAASDQGLIAVEWAGSQLALDSHLARLKGVLERNPEKLAPYSRELLAYTHGELREFSFEVDWASLRPFQRKAMQAVYAIPYGETRTYSDIAHEIGHPNAPRAVGRANATNPMPLVIPCHRLIGSDGKLHGYGGGEGLKTKEWLLKMEGAILS